MRAIVKAVILLLGLAQGAMGADVPPPPQKGKTATAPRIHYKEGAAVKFDAMEIQGAWQGPDTLIVNGDVERGAFDLLSLRQNFSDREISNLGQATLPKKKEAKK